MAYTEEQITKMKDFLIDQISNTTIGIRRLKKMFPDDIPAVSTLMLWLKEDKEFSEQYTHAKQMQAEIMIDEAMCIADDDSDDIIKVDSDGVEIEKVNHENINRSRLRVDIRKWHASKLAPKLYGDKIDHTTNGKEINTTQEIKVNHLTTEQLKELLNGDK